MLIIKCNSTEHMLKFIKRKAYDEELINVLTTFIYKFTARRMSMRK
jgi:hypothetical protein